MVEDDKKVAVDSVVLSCYLEMQTFYSVPATSVSKEKAGKV